jgi:hypothetical protein
MAMAECQAVIGKAGLVEESAKQVAKATTA